MVQFFVASVGATRGNEIMPPQLILLSDEARLAHYMTLMEYLTVQTGYEEQGDTEKVDSPQLLMQKRAEFIALGQSLGIERDANMMRLTGVDRFIRQQLEADSDPVIQELILPLWREIMDE